MSSENSNNELVDIRGILTDYVKHWWLFLLCIIGCVALAFVYLKIHKQEYAVRANILIQQDDSRGGNAANLRNAFGDLAGMFGSKGNVDDEVHVVKSHSVLMEVAKELGLERRHSLRGLPTQWSFMYKGFPVEVIIPEGIADTLATSLSFRLSVNDKGVASVKVKANGINIMKEKGLKLPFTLSTDYGDFTFIKTADYPKNESFVTRISVDGYHAVAEALAADVEIEIASKKANVISLKTKNVDRAYAKDILNSIIAKYNARSIKDRSEKSEKTAKFIEDRIELLSGDLTQAEKSIETFKSQNGITDLYADATYEFQRKGSLEASLVEAQANQIVLEELKRYMQRPENRYEMLPVVPDKGMPSDVVIAYNNLISQRMKMAGASSGSTASGGLALKKIDEQINAQKANVIQSLDQAEQAAALTVREIKGKLNEADSRLGNMPQQQRVYQTLLRDQRFKEELYMFLLQRGEETAMSLANNTPKALIIDYAFSDSKPLGMAAKKVLLLALILGFLLAPAILYIRQMLRNRFETPQEVERLTKVPMLGEVCTSRSRHPLVVKPSGSSSITELFRLIRTNLQFVLSDKNDRVIIVTSTRSGEGKSFVAINLASSLALINKKVILVGMDIRAPQLSNYLELEPHAGVSEYLSNEDITVSDIIMHNPLDNGMDIISSGPVPPNPGELLLSNRVDSLFDELRKEYDYIIVDSAPVGMVSDTFSLVRISDATIYVCRAQYTSLNDVRYLDNLYRENRFKKMSLVVNGTAARKGYGYGYGHSKDD